MLQFNMARNSRVAQGAGMFNLPKATFSKETQDLLKGRWAGFLLAIVNAVALIIQ